MGILQGFLSALPAQAGMILSFSIKFAIGLSFTRTGGDDPLSGEGYSMPNVLYPHRRG